MPSKKPKPVLIRIRVNVSSPKARRVRWDLILGWLVSAAAILARLVHDLLAKDGS